MQIFIKKLIILISQKLVGTFAQRPELRKRAGISVRSAVRSGFQNERVINT
jgi:hypothetical protein